MLIFELTSPGHNIGESVWTLILVTPLLEISEVLAAETTHHKSHNLTKELGILDNVTTQQLQLFSGLSSHLQ